jgi:hypothetical protein
MKTEISPQRLNLIKKIAFNFKDSMFMDKPAAELLMVRLNEKLEMFKTEPEQLEFLIQIYKIKETRDFNYLGSIQSFFSDVRDKIDFMSIVSYKDEGKSSVQLPDCFLDKKYFETILNHPKVSDLYTKDSDGRLILKPNKKTHLAGLAHRLFEQGKLNPDIIKTYQDLARVFCPYFHVSFNPNGDKQFQPDRAKTDVFFFIK